MIRASENSVVLSTAKSLRKTSYEKVSLFCKINDVEYRKIEQFTKIIKFKKM